MGALQRQQEEEERKRRQQNMNQMMTNYAFHATGAHRGNDEKTSDQFELLVRDMRDIVLKEDFKMENRTGETPKPTTVVSGLDRENFAYGTLRACEELGWTCDYLWEKKKIKVKAPVKDDGTVEFTMNWYEMDKVNCFEFMKKSGTHEVFHETVKKFHSDFDKLSTEQPQAKEVQE